MLKGVDISTYQGAPNFATLRTSLDFVISKTTEGNVLPDSQFARNQSEVRRVGLLTGFYHFARPDLGNSPENEAQAFINYSWPWNEGEIVLLDYEVQYNDPVSWCKRWLDYIKAHCDGTKALIYLNKSTESNYNWKPVVDGGYGLWLADYDNNPTSENHTPKHWPFVAIKQYADQARINGINGIVDADTFFGDATAFKKYGYKKPATIDPIQAQINDMKSKINTSMSDDQYRTYKNSFEKSLLRNVDRKLLGV